MAVRFERGARDGMGTAALPTEHAAALAAAIEAMPPGMAPHEARAEAERLIAAYGEEAVNVALACQDALLERGQDVAALTLLQVITAIWDIEDGR